MVIEAGLKAWKFFNKNPNVFFFSSFINFSWFEEFEKKYFCDQGEYFVNVNNYDWNWIFLHAIEWPLNNNNRIGKRIWKKDNNKKVYQSIWTTLNTLCKYCNMFVSYFMVLLCYFFPFTHILCIQYTRTHTHTNCGQQIMFLRVSYHFIFVIMNYDLKTVWHAMI